MSRKFAKTLRIVVFLSVLCAGSIMWFLDSTSAPDLMAKEAVDAVSSTQVQNVSFTPTVWKPSWADVDNNSVADSLDAKITSNLVSGEAQKNANVTVMLRSEPTFSDADIFTRLGGYLTTSPWTYALYGFGGVIPYDQVQSFVQADANVLLVEETQTCSANVAYAAKQVGARPYVWNTMGLQGDSQSSIAVLDTGIDDSHPDFSPGYGNLNFSKKIVGWNDQISPGSPSPYDDNGHGSHVSGLAAGDGFFSTDGSGNAFATWGAGLGSLSTGPYWLSGMMVNKTGTITIRMKWRNYGISGSITAIRLYYGDKSLGSTSWPQVTSVSTPSQDTWYSLSYPVASTPSGGYDMYHVRISVTSGILSNFYLVFTISWPYTPPADGFSAWTGIAPQTRLVGVKALNYYGSGSEAGLLNAIDWIIANRMTYHIVVASMSLGFNGEVPSIDVATANLVNSGIATVISAGNSGPGGNYVFTPGSVDEALTVAAINQFDDITTYSSQGGTSGSTGHTVKPDIAAPGGSFLAVPLFSADSNDGDADTVWPEVALNDAAPMQGTSMSAPVAAGATSIVAQAMGGFSIWQWTRNQALLPKMILLMTATETYPNPREGSGGAPTLERGGKDVHEGFGRLNLDAAVEAVLQTYPVGTSVAGVLGRPPSLSDISVLGQRLAWARKVQLITEATYNFTVTVPAGADFDMYLYNSTGTFYGEPAIVAKSTSAASGGTEQIVITPPYSGIYYLVVKRARADSLGGSFMLESSAKLLGDVNSDGAVNTVDLSVLYLAYGSTLGSAKWNQACDLNGDGRVDAADLRAFGRNFGKSV